MAENAEDTNLEDFDLGDVEEVNLSNADPSESGNELDLPEMDDSPFDLEGSADDLDDLGLETEAVGNLEDAGILDEASKDSGDAEDAGDFDFGEEDAKSSEKVGIITENGELVISDAEEETPEIDLAGEDEGAEPAAEADSGEGVEGLDLDDASLDDNIDLAPEDESGGESEAEADTAGEDKGALEVEDSEPEPEAEVADEAGDAEGLDDLKLDDAEALDLTLEGTTDGEEGADAEPDLTLGDMADGEEGTDTELDLALDDMAAEEETPEIELALADTEDATEPELADEDDPFRLEDESSEPELAGDDPFDLAESEPELADFAEGEASDEGAEEPDLLEEVDTGIGDLAGVEDAGDTEESAPEGSGDEDAIGLEEVALGTAAAAMAGATASNTSTDSDMNGDKDESGALVAQAGPERLLNFQHEVVVEVARTKLTGEEITQITYGSIIELDKVAGEPVNLVLDGRVIAHGEMVLINEDKLGIRIIGIMQE